MDLTVAMLEFTLGMEMHGYKVVPTLMEKHWAIISAGLWR